MQPKATNEPTEVIMTNEEQVEAAFESWREKTGRFYDPDCIQRNEAMMPTTTNPTPAEVAALERRIAEGVMGWPSEYRAGWGEPGFYPPDRPMVFISGTGEGRQCNQWSPWHDPVAALEVLERLAKGGPYWIQRVDSKTFEVGLEFPSDERGEWAESPGDHYGPAVCLLARNIIKVKKYQPVLTEKQREALISAVAAWNNPPTMEILNEARDAVLVLSSALEYPLGRRVRCNRSNPDLSPLTGRIAGPAWDVKTDRGIHLFVRDGEFELLHEPEGAELIGKQVKIREHLNGRVKGHARERSVEITRINGPNVQTVEVAHHYGHIVRFEQNRANGYMIVLDIGIWGMFARDEFDLID